MTRDHIVLGIILSRIGVLVHSGSVANDVYVLDRLARRHHRLAEHECNGELTKRQRTMQTNAETEIRSILSRYHGVSVTFQGDPRGCTVQLTLPGGEYNSFGGYWGI